MRFSRGKRARFAATAVGVVVTVTALALLAFPAQGEDARYEFSNVQATYATDDRTQTVDPSRSEVSYDIAWSGQTFPGVLECTWRVYDENGSLIGETSDTLMVLRPAGAHGEREVPISGGTPTSADILCGNNRLDQSGNYNVSNIKVERATLPDGSTVPRTLKVTFDATWITEGTVGEPGASTCSVTVYGSDGSVLVQQDVTLVVADGSGTSLEATVRPGNELRQRPASADIDCRPFGT